MLSTPALDYFVSQYDHKYCRQIIKFCSEGRSPEAFASEINSTPEVFVIWAKYYIEFECALHIAFWKSYAWWDKEAINPDKLSLKGFAPIFNAVMKNRFKWKDGNEDLQRIVRKLNDEDLEELARRLLSEKTVTINRDETLEDERES